MKIANTKLDGLLVIEPTVYEDERDFFMKVIMKKIYGDNRSVNKICPR